LLVNLIPEDLMIRNRAGLHHLVLALIAFPTATFAQLNSSTVDRMAIYVANTSNRSNLPDSSVNYNITSPATIDAILSGIDFTEQLDCSDVEAKNTSYMYVKLKSGGRKVYHLFHLDSHIAVEGRRDLCFFVSPAARAIIAANAQS